MLTREELRLKQEVDEEEPEPEGDLERDVSV